MENGKMINIKIRRAKSNDLKTIQKLNNELFEFEMNKGLDEYKVGWAYGKNASNYFADLIKNQFVAIAEVGSESVGYLVGSIYNDETYSYYEGKTAELENMLILENYRRFGIGTKLINSFTMWCEDNKVKRIFVTATLGNDDAINFYKKHGFEGLNITLKKEIY